MQKYPLSSLREEMTFTSDLMLDENFILLPAGCPTPRELSDALRTWEFTDFQCEGTFDFNSNILS